MPTDALRKRFRAHLEDQQAREEARFVDIAIAWEDPAGETLGFYGGQWDQIEQRYTGKDPERCAVLKFEKSQLELVQWAGWWMQERAAGRPRDFAALFAIGDRGAGKTYAAVGILGTLQIEFPTFDRDHSIAWIVSRAHADRSEVDRTFKTIFPSQWYQYREWPHHCYKWLTGAQMFNATAESIEGLRAKGRVDFVMINEAGIMPKAVPFSSIPRIKDKGGLAILTANPPQTTKGQWILDMHEKAETAKEANKPFYWRFVHMLSGGNTTRDTGTADQVAQMLADLDPRAAKADVEGLLLPIGDRAYFKFAKLLHMREAPELGDITREFTKRRLGRVYDYIGGVDFQGTPHHAAVICKIYGTLDAPMVFVVDEFVAENSTEDELLDQIDEAGYQPESLLWVGDASGQWQDGKHSGNGRDSFKVFTSRRWRIVPPAEKKSDKGTWSKNPPIEKRVGLTNKLFADDRLRVSPRLAKLGEALRECPWVKARYGGKPTGFYSHITDAMGYVCWWVFPAPKRVITSGGDTGFTWKNGTKKVYG